MFSADPTLPGKHVLQTKYCSASLLPVVSGSVREKVARDFDHLGPDACLVEILENDLAQYNPEFLTSFRDAVSALLPCCVRIWF
jgi:hypothetical protein